MTLDEMEAIHGCFPLEKVKPFLSKVRQYANKAFDLSFIHARRGTCAGQIYMCNFILHIHRTFTVDCFFNYMPGNIMVLKIPKGMLWMSSVNFLILTIILLTLLSTRN